MKFVAFLYTATPHSPRSKISLGGTRVMTKYCHLHPPPPIENHWATNCVTNKFISLRSVRTEKKKKENAGMLNHSSYV